MNMSSPVEMATARPLRADADRNRRAVITAAERLFAERGFDVPLGEVAAAAGVGRATLYRHFSTRTDLAFALFERDMQRLRDFAASQKGEPGDFEELIGFKLQCYIRSGGLAEAVQRESRSVDFAKEREEIAGLFWRAAQPAMNAGVLRSDLTIESFLMLDLAISGVMLSGGTVADRRERAERLKSMLLDGLRCCSGVKPAPVPEG